jgi:hypothetical protein
MNMAEITRGGPAAIPPGLTIESYTVASWCPSPDGSGPATAVALILEVKQLPYSLVMRLKSGDAVNDMIRALEEHRDLVFGEEEAIDCRSCLGLGHFNDEGQASSDRRDRKCTDCRGTGSVPIISG